MRSGLVQLARGLRRNETSAEAVLWSELRNRQMDGWKFKRQVPFGNFIIDFFCYDARLAVEVDGATHSAAKEISQDAERTAFLESNGVRLVRFSNTDIFDNLDGALETIYLELGQQPGGSPGAPRVGADAPGRRPLPKGRGDAQAAKGESK